MKRSGARAVITGTLKSAEKGGQKIALAIAVTVVASPQAVDTMPRQGKPQEVKLLQPLRRRASLAPRQPRVATMVARTAIVMATARHVATTGIGMNSGQTGRRVSDLSTVPARKAAATNTGARTGGTSVARSGVSPGP
jgi:hypothetical protein